MRRVYGYKRRDHACGKRYQDGKQSQARSDKPLVIENRSIGAAVAESGEELELKLGLGVRATEPTVNVKMGDDSVDPENPVQPEPETSIAGPAEDPDNDTGELPGHLTGFMPTTVMAPAAGDQPNEAGPETDPDAE